MIEEISINDFPNTFGDMRSKQTKQTLYNQYIHYTKGLNHKFLVVWTNKLATGKHSFSVHRSVYLTYK